MAKKIHQDGRRGRKGPARAGRPELVYFDTNVWVKLMLKAEYAGIRDVPDAVRDEVYSVPDHLLDRLKPGKRCVVITDWLRAEAMGVLRKTLTKMEEYGGSEPKRIRRVQAAVEVKVRRRLEEDMESLVRSGKAVYKRPGVNSADLHAKTVKSMGKDVGWRIRVANTCPECERRLGREDNGVCPHCMEQITPNMSYECRALECEDWVHAVVAEACGVRLFYTFDKGFRKPHDDGKFGFKVKVLKEKAAGRQNVDAAGGGGGSGQDA